jgi:hypothetical protein
VEFCFSGQTERKRLLPKTRAVAEHGVRAGRSDSPEAAMGLQFETTQQIDAMWNPGERGGEHPEQAGLGCAEFDDIGAQSAEKAPEENERTKVSQRRDGSFERNGCDINAFAGADAIEHRAGACDQRNAEPAVLQCAETPRENETGLGAGDADDDMRRRRGRLRHASIRNGWEVKQLEKACSHSKRPSREKQLEGA